MDERLVKNKNSKSLNGVLESLVGTQAYGSSTEQPTYGVLDALVGTQDSEGPTDQPTGSASNFGVLESLVGTQDSEGPTEPTSASNQHDLERPTQPVFSFDVAHTLKHGLHVLLVNPILKGLLSDNMLEPASYTPPWNVRIPTVLTGKDNHKCTVVIYYKAGDPVFLVHVDHLELIPKGRYVSNSKLCASMSFSPEIFRTVLTSLGGMNLGQEKLLTSITEYLGIIFEVVKHLPTSVFASLFWVLVSTSTGLDEQVVSTMQEFIGTMLGDLVAARPSDDWAAFKAPRREKVSSGCQVDVAAKRWQDLVRVVNTHAKPTTTTTAV